MSINSNLHSKFLLYGPWYSDFQPWFQIRITWGIFKTKQNKKLMPDSTLGQMKQSLGMGLDICIFKSSPGDSNLHPRLRTTVETLIQE